MPENTDTESRMGEQMNRRELREQIFMLLFRVEFNQKDDMPEQCTLSWKMEIPRFPKRMLPISVPNMKNCRETAGD